MKITFGRPMLSLFYSIILPPYQTKIMLSLCVCDQIHIHCVESIRVPNVLYTKTSQSVFSSLLHLSLIADFCSILSILWNDISKSIYKCSDFRTPFGCKLLHCHIFFRCERTRNEQDGHARNESACLWRVSENPISLYKFSLANVVCKCFCFF